ncbi:MAG: DNA methyltransferase [Candidatus Peregrinibacteria bacterium]
MTIQEATKWATAFLKEDISSSNISYLVQYGKVKKYGDNGTTKIALEDLKKYYMSYRGKREVDWKKILGNDLNWGLSFDHLRERDTTKHVHRLHPYKGKFIPQLVEYFLDTHTDDFKKQVFFQKGDIVLDPFLGSGTTLVQANELGIHGIGIDVSRFNCVVAGCKVQTYNLEKLEEAIEAMKKTVAHLEDDAHIQAFEKELLAELSVFNARHFPSPQFKYKVYRKEIEEESYAQTKERMFLPVYQALLKKYKIQIQHRTRGSFLDIWYLDSVRREIDAMFAFVKKQPDRNIKELLAVILSRTARSCRATTHSDLATLKEPQRTTYYCFKHKKICKPLFSLRKMLEWYATDTLTRIRCFSSIKTPSLHCIISGDSRSADIATLVKAHAPSLAPIFKEQGVRGIFSSPPYVGQIDYHEQHAYAYDLFGFERKDALEIGPLCKGQTQEARTSYTEGIAAVLNNCKRCLTKDYDVFLVANDKWNLYPTIAEEAGMKIVNTFKRPVLNRTERDRNPYAETIFHMKEYR